jgi:hypothetical protein
MAVAKQVKKLREAQLNGEVVEVHRSMRRADRLRGFVVGVGKRWLMLQLVEDVTFNGYSAILLGDIDMVRVSARKGSFILRALVRSGSGRC